MLRRCVAIAACVAWWGVAAPGAGAEPLRLCDYWPLAPGNAWDYPDGARVIVAEAPDLPNGPQWALVGDPAESETVFLTLAEGHWHRQASAFPPTVGPGDDDAWEAYLPETFTPDEAVALPGGAVITPMRGTLRDLLAETGDSFDPDAFSHGAVEDAVVFMADGAAASPYFGRGLGVLFTEPVAVAPGCAAAESGEEDEADVEVPDCEGNRLRDGGFEAGSGTAAWVLRPLGGAIRLYENAAQARNGRWYAEFTGAAGAPTVAHLEQTVQLPAYSTGTLRFALGKPTTSGNGTDTIEVFLDDQRLVGYGEAINLPPGTYQTAQLTLPGTNEARTATLRFTASGNGSPRETVWRVDDVCLRVTPRVSDACGLATVALTRPVDGARLYLSPDRPAGRVALEAGTNCPDRTSAIAFYLGAGAGRRLLNTATAAPFTAALPLSLIDGPGEIFIALEAAGETAQGGDATAIGGARLDVRAADTGADANGNGLPDRPFEALPGASDLWITERRTATGARVAAHVAPLRAPDAGTPAPADRVVTLESPMIPGQRVIVTVPGDLLNNEIGMLIAQIAPDLPSLLGANVAGAIGGEPAGRPNGPALYLHLSVLVSASGGADFTEIPASRLAQRPIGVRFEGIRLAGDGADYLATYRTVAGEADGALAFAAGTDTWRTLAAQSADPASGVISGSLATLGVVTHYGTADPGGGGGGGQPGVILLILAALGILQLADGGPCFIATAAYGTPLAAEIGALRAVRDEWLLANPFGTALVDAYYRISPPLADIVAASPILAALVRAGLVPVIVLAQAAQTLPGWAWIAALAGLVIAARRITRRTVEPRARIPQSAPEHGGAQAEAQTNVHRQD